MNRTQVYLCKYRQVIIDFCAALIVLFLPISAAIPNLLLIPLAIIVILTFKSYVAVKPKHLLAFSISIIVILILGVLNSNFIEGITIYSRYLIVLLVLALFSQVKNKSQLEHFFIAGVLIAVLGSSVAIGIKLFKNAAFLLDAGSEVNRLLWADRPYLGFMLTICVFYCLKIAENRPKRIWYYILAFIFILFNIYISARLSIILSIILIFTFLYRSTYFNLKTKYIATFMLLGLFVSAISISDNISSRMHKTNDMELSWHLIKDYEPRLIIWPCAIEIIQKEKVLLKGLGSYQDVKNKLVDCYGDNIKKNKEKRDYYVKSKFNTHNQFLDFLLVGGVVPFILLIYTFLSGCFSKNNAFELKFILALFLAFFFVENVLHRQLGVYLFSIFIALYSNKNK